MSEPHTSTDPAEPSASGPPSMRDQWAELISTRHSPRRWAVIAAAIATADAAPVDRFGEPVQRGDETWCRVAITALESPTSAETARELPDVLPRRCFADPDLLRAWLTAPAAYGDPGRTVAEGLDLVDWATASHEAIHQAIANTLEQAHDVGVFGVDGYRLEVHRLVGTDDGPASYLLVARPPFGPGLTADEPVDDALIPTQERSIVEGAVQMLTNAAAILDAVLDTRDAAQTPMRPTASPRRGQPFRAGAEPAGGAQPPPPDAGVPTTPRRPRSR
jgi:hypothetical protein